MANKATRYEMQWHNWLDDAWHCQSYHSNKANALQTMRWQWKLARGKFPYRLIDRHTDAVIKTIEEKNDD